MISAVVLMLIVWIAGVVSTFGLASFGQIVRCPNQSSKAMRQDAFCVLLSIAANLAAIIAIAKLLERFTQ